MTLEVPADPAARPGSDCSSSQATRGTSRVESAVIVAAGRGSRLEDGSATPKPLRRVAGVALIARVMHAAARAGIRDFTVVIGYQSATLRHELPALVPSGTSLTLLENERYDEPNGVSLLVAAERFRSGFALLMADHLFAPERLERALAAFDGTSLLVVEPRETFAADLDDATRVAVTGGCITAIGKLLDEFDAIDTGMFVLDGPKITAALRSAGPSPSISDGVRRLTAESDVEAFDPRCGWWLDVDTPDDLRAAERCLLASLRKPNDGILARAVNRRISLFLTARLWRLGITPNAVTLGTLVVGLAAGWAFAQGADVGSGLVGATLFQAQSIIDGVDGELARLLLRESRFGFWLDLAVDNLTHIAVFAGIAAGQAASGVPGPWLVLGVAAATGVVASVAVLAPVLAEGSARRRARGALARLVDGLSRRDFTYALFPLAIFGGLGWFLWAAAIGTWTYAALALALRLPKRRNAVSAGAV